MNYIKSHWRGDLSLANSFWLGLVGMTLGYALFNFVVIFAAGTLMELSNKSMFSCHVFLSGAIITIVLGYPITLWQLGGLWRASEQHIKTTSKSFWARVCQIITVSIVIILIYGMMSYEEKVFQPINKIYSGCCEGEPVALSSVA